MSLGSLRDSSSGYSGTQPASGHYDVFTVAQLTGLKISDVQSMMKYYADTKGSGGISLDTLVAQYLGTGQDAALYRILDQSNQLLTGRGLDQGVINAIRARVNSLNPNMKATISRDLLQALKGGGQMPDLAKAIEGYEFLNDILKPTALGSTRGRSGGGGVSLTPQQSAVDSLRYSLAAQFKKATGHDASDAQINQMLSMNEVDLPKFFSSQPYKFGLTLGQFEDNQSRIDGQYMKYFGRKATDQEVVWSNGKSDDDINNHIMASPSKVDGLNMGQYTSYRKALDNISTNMWGYAAPDDMVKEFHDSQQKGPGQ